jgi:hypothetical protein
VNGSKELSLLELAPLLVKVVLFGHGCVELKLVHEGL